MDITEVQHESITVENRPSLSKHMEKFDSFEAAALDGMSLKQQMGKPFKMPESMDKLADDNVRADFTSQANKLLGHEFADDIAGLADLDLKAGSKADTPTDEALANGFKQFVVDNKVPKAQAQKMLAFYNEAMGKAVEANGVKQEATFDANAKETNAGLVKHFLTQEKVDAESELLRRAVLNHKGMTTERAEKVADVFVKAMQEGGSDAAVTLLEMIAPMAREGGSHAGDGGNNQAAPATIAKQLPNTAKALGWK